MVLEFSRHRFVHLMQDAQGGVAVGDAGNNHPKAIHISDLGKAQVLEVHLLVDGV